MLLNKDEIVNAITQTLPISKQTQQIIDYLYSEEEAEKEKENILSNNIRLFPSSLTSKGISIRTG